MGNKVTIMILMQASSDLSSFSWLDDRFTFQACQAVATLISKMDGRNHIWVVACEKSSLACLGYRLKV
jgi:hypothetical protein